MMISCGGVRSVLARQQLSIARIHPISRSKCHTHQQRVSSSMPKPPSSSSTATTTTTTTNKRTVATTAIAESIGAGGQSSSGCSSSSSFFWTIWEGYTALLFARPLTVKATTASVIFFVSDSATQFITEPTGHKWDAARAGSGAAFGVVATGWLHHWWGFLESFVGRRIPVATNRFANTLVKVFLDQAIGAPLYIYTYYVITNFIQDLKNRRLEHDSNVVDKDMVFDTLKDTCDKASEMLMPTMFRHWTLWPAVHTLNFYYSPLHHRVLVQNLVLVGWSGCK